jgi:hypothetical protein
MFHFLITTRKDSGHYAMESNRKLADWAARTLDMSPKRRRVG